MVGEQMQENSNAQQPANMQDQVEGEKKFYSQWWFWVIVVVILGIGIYYGFMK